MVSSYTSISGWKDKIAETVNEFVSTAIGVFSTDGKLIEANELMCVLLDVNNEKSEPANFFVNPTFSALAKNKNDENVFEGLLTIGNYSDVNYVLNSKIFRKDDILLVVAKADVKHLFDENRKMSQLNQEVNNLQRQLIKEKKKLQTTLNELRETQQLLIHSEKMNALGLLVAGVAHEINNPIAFVNSNLYSLQENTSEIIGTIKEIEQELEQHGNPKIIQSVQKICKENEVEYLTEDIQDSIQESKVGIERVKKIVEDLRNFSRLDEAEVKYIDLVENINSTLSIVRSQLNSKNIRFEFVADEKLEIDCFPGQLNQAILNIIVNAIYAVETGGTIILRVTEQKEHVQISIADNGCGISSDILKKIFDLFFTTKPVGSGTGLGLSITYKIIHDLHKGKINVNTEPGKGTEFILEIPKRTNL